MDTDNLEAIIHDRNKTHIIYDFDKTIAWLDVDWGEIVKAVLDVARNHGYTETPTAALMGGIYNEIADQIADDDVCRKLLEAWGITELDTLRGYNTNDLVIDYIKSTPDKYSYIFSNNGKRVLDKVLEILGLTEVFDLVITHDDVTRLKPDPQGMYLILDDNIPVSNYLMVGNSSSDRLAAQAVGIDFYLVQEYESEYHEYKS